MLPVLARDLQDRTWIAETTIVMKMYNISLRIHEELTIAAVANQLVIAWSGRDSRGLPATSSRVSDIIVIRVTRQIFRSHIRVFPIDEPGAVAPLSPDVTVAACSRGQTVFIDARINMTLLPRTSTTYSTC